MDVPAQVSGSVIPLEGHIDSLGLGLIANGIRKSPEVERWIKELL